MKKTLAVIVALAATSALASAGYLFWASKTFAKREIKRVTREREIHILDEVHAQDHWYAKAVIDGTTARRLLGQYVWMHGFEKQIALAGKVAPEGLPDCPICYYRIEIDPHDRQFHPYTYRLYVLSPDLKTLEVYEQFGS